MGELDILWRGAHVVVVGPAVRDRGRWFTIGRYDCGEGPTSCWNNLISCVSELNFSYASELLNIRFSYTTGTT